MKALRLLTVASILIHLAARYVCNGTNPIGCGQAERLQCTKVLRTVLYQGTTAIKISSPRPLASGTYDLQRSHEALEDQWPPN
jgi:hypothetical protein